MPDTHIRFTDPDPAVDARVAELLDQMTLQEKIGQMTQHGIAPGMTEKHSTVATGAVGSTLASFDVDQINKLQKLTIDESRLGIPLMVGNDVIHGFRTVFPIPLAEACSWDLDLIERTSRMAAEEASACGTDWIFGPMVDIARDPRWGRIAEGSGEDVHLGGEIARAKVRGYQAKGLATGKTVVACPKHYVAYGAAEAGKDYNTVDVSENALRDVYLPPFAAAFDEGAGSTMSAFNDINGVPASANSMTLRQVLRDQWNWPGVVLSDAHAVGELIDHGVAADYRDAAQMAAIAGIDIDMGSPAFPEHLAAAVDAGEVDEALIDEAAGRVLRLKLLLGLFDKSTTDPSIASALLGCDDHLDLARESAHKSMVLLKNDDVLPLSTEAKRIAVIGPLADNAKAPLGCWHCQGREEDVVTVLEGLRSAVVGSECEIAHVGGCAINDGCTDGFDDAVVAATGADVAVVVVGEDWDMSGEAQCRAHLGLPGVQQELVDAVVATGTPVVVVLMAGRPLTIERLTLQADSVLLAWHGGVETGPAVADLLFGRVNPSAKLVVTIPRCEGQIPLYYNHRSTSRIATGEGSDGWDQPYKSRYWDEWNSPLFPFGFGLSYTTFAYRDLVVHTPSVSADGIVRVSVTVANTGAVAGDEIVQLYTRDVVASLTRPMTELKGFERISLAPGESRTVEFEIPAASLGFTNAAMQYVVEPGAFEVMVGPNSVEGLAGAFEVVG